MHSSRDEGFQTIEATLYNIQKLTEFKMQRDLVENNEPEETEHSMGI